MRPSRWAQYPLLLYFPRMKIKIKAGIIGATSYTGRELVSILLCHPHVEVAWLTSQSREKVDYCHVYPQFTGRVEEKIRILRSFEDIASDRPEVVFSCLPHGASAKLLSSFIGNGKTRIVDLSADFRFRDINTYEKTYQTVHPVPASLGESQYGLPEIYQEAIRGANIIGNPGCYPTSILLPLIPLLEARLVKAYNIVADSKSGVSGAGRNLTETTHFINCHESLKAYKIADQHRHLPEIKEQLASAAGKEVEIIFVPHLVPMERGILSTIYGDLEEGVSVKEIKSCLAERFDKSPFVYLVEHLPGTGEVKNTNHCHIYVYTPEKSGRLLIISVLDNLVKGGSGQAVQNMNIMFGFPQTAGLI